MSMQPADHRTGLGAGRPAYFARGGRSRGGTLARPSAPGQRLRGVVAWLRNRPAPGRVPQRCGSWAPVAYLDGLKIQDVQRWSTRCDLLEGHTGFHRSASDTWR